MYTIKIIPHTLYFKRPAGTSRGIYTERKVWYLRVTSPEHPDRVGIGECAPLPKLSCDDLPDYEQILARICRTAEQQEGKLNKEELLNYPSIAFGLETAFRHYETGSFALQDTPFSRGQAGIPINGLIWMGDYDAMYTQIKEKIEKGFRCIKLKIGAINFEEELALLHYIRRQFSATDIELRVDANGAFAPDEAEQKLARLAEFDLHSIEQPIRAGQWELMARLAEKSPVPIALDEELIGHHTPADIRLLLKTIRPSYLIIKPSLHSNKDEWIAQASRLGIGWWATSALESNIGLNAIAQWVSLYTPSVPQGLGTGLLFTENITLPIAIEQDKLWYHPQKHQTTSKAFL